MSNNNFSPTEVWAELTETVVWGGLWERAGLSNRDRSLITIAILAATGRAPALDFHIKKAAQNGLSADEITEAMVHTAFYAGWPVGGPAMRAVERVLYDGGVPSE